MSQVYLLGQGCNYTIFNISRAENFIINTAGGIYSNSGLVFSYVSGSETWFNEHIKLQRGTLGFNGDDPIGSTSLEVEQTWLNQLSKTVSWPYLDDNYDLQYMDVELDHVGAINAS